MYLDAVNMCIDRVYILRPRPLTFLKPEHPDAVSSSCLSEQHSRGIHFLTWQYPSHLSFLWPSYFPSHIGMPSSVPRTSHEPFPLQPVAHHPVRRLPKVQLDLTDEVFVVLACCALVGCRVSVTCRFVLARVARPVRYI